MSRSKRTNEISGLVNKYYKTKDSDLIRDIQDDELDTAITEYKPYKIGNDLITRDNLDKLKSERKEVKNKSKYWSDLVKSNVVKYIFIGLFLFLSWLLDWFTWLYNLFT